MRKGCDGEEEEVEKKRIVKIAVNYRRASNRLNGDRLECQPLVLITISIISMLHVHLNNAEHCMSVSLQNAHMTM